MIEPTDISYALINTRIAKRRYQMVKVVREDTGMSYPLRVDIRRKTQSSSLNILGENIEEKIYEKYDIQNVEWR